MNYEEMRLQCLKLAMEIDSTGDNEDLIYRAQRFSDFVTGRNTPKIKIVPAVKTSSKTV